MTEPADKPRIKNLVGMLVMIVGLTLYAFAAAAVGETLAPVGIWLEIPYYIVAGIIWIWPAKALLDWMAPKAPPKDPNV